MHTWVVYIQKKGNSQVSKRSLVTEAIDPRIMMNRSLRYSIINPVQLLVDTHRLDFIAYGSKPWLQKSINKYLGIVWNYKAMLSRAIKWHFLKLEDQMRAYWPTGCYASRQMAEQVQRPGPGPGSRHNKFHFNYRARQNYSTQIHGSFG